MDSARAHVDVSRLFDLAASRNFGDSLRSRNDVAMVNEALLCKFLCHNLCCVILSQMEIGIGATFWDAKDEPAVDVLPIVRRD